MKLYSDGETSRASNNTCANCGDWCLHKFCSRSCQHDYEGTTECDAGHVHEDGEDCPECET